MKMVKLFPLEHGVAIDFYAVSVQMFLISFRILVNLVWSSTILCLWLLLLLALLSSLEISSW